MTEAEEILFNARQAKNDGLITREDEVYVVSHVKAWLEHECAAWEVVKEMETE